MTRILARGPWRGPDITIARVNNPKVELPIVTLAKQQRLPELNKQAAQPNSRLFDGLVCGLRSMEVKYRPDGSSYLYLRYSVDDYFSVESLDLALDDEVLLGEHWTTLRHELFSDSKILPAFSPHLVNLFGIGAVLVTSDNQALLTRRHHDVATYGGHFTSSINEAASYPSDTTTRDFLNPLKIVIRGALEELGVPLARRNIIFLSLEHDPVFNQYSLLALARTPLTCKELERTVNQSYPVDRWENSDLYFVPWELNPLLDFMSSHRPWITITILEAARYSFGETEVRQALLDRNLPFTIPRLEPITPPPQHH
jgi:hypothetical protein